MSSHVVDKNHAIVHTLTVQVKALTIGKKQVTLSMFKQIPCKKIMKITGEYINCKTLDQTFVHNFLTKNKLVLNGIPWGYVRYNPTSENWFDKYLIWSDGSSIYKDELPDFYDWKKKKEFISIIESIPDLIECESRDYRYILHSTLKQEYRGTIALDETLLRDVIKNNREFNNLDQLFIAV